MEMFSFGILHIFAHAASDLVHTLLQDGHNLVRIEASRLLNGRRKRGENSVVSCRSVSRHLAESLYIALNKWLREFIVVNPPDIGIIGDYVVAHPLGGLPEAFLLGLHIDANLNGRDLDFARLSGKRNSHRGGKDREYDMGV